MKTKVLQVSVPNKHSVKHIRGDVDVGRSPSLVASPVRSTVVSFMVPEVEIG